jgi:hypothetical protein
LHPSSCAEAAQEKQARQGDQSEMAERQAPSVFIAAPMRAALSEADPPDSLFIDLDRE